jgi:cell cycle sensor histidine kinase DivJ
MFDLTVEPIDIAPLIDACCQMMAHQAVEQGVVLTNSVSSGLPELVADRRAFRQMVINLVANAIKFSNRNGCITVGARLDRDMVAVYVRDQGIGISEIDLQRIGTPFVQVESTYHRRFAGTGLGLSMVKGLAALHGGRREIESRLGAGTTATILLPLRGPAGAQRQPTRTATPAAVTEERKSA